MNNREIAGLAFNSIRYRSLRSWLAIMGIVIGVASIISLISISVGMNDQIQKNLGGLGANLITISSGGSQAGSMGFGGGPPMGGQGGMGGSGSTETAITFQEAEQLKKVANVSAVDARLQERATVTYRNKNASLTVIGTEPSAFPASAAATLLQGTAFLPGDTSSAILGYSVATETFNDSMLNKPIKIDGKVFRVIGILNTSGSSFGGPDRNVFISQRAAKTLFSQTQNASSVIAITASGSDPDVVAAAIAVKLRALHRVTAAKQDFTVSTASSMQSTISSVTGTLSLFLGAIASISLIVGGIGVANAMFTSVLEQTKYIGLLKALGARKRMILKLFVFEAGLVGLVGGILGIVLSFAGSAVLTSFGMPSRISLELLALGLGVSMLVGIVSGLIPARNAASVAPVEALKYE